MALTINQIFGADVSLDETVAGDPKLVIRLQNFQNDGVGAGQILDNTGLNNAGLITDANKDEYSHKLLAAILKLHLQQQPSENTDETLGTYIDFNPNFNKSFVTRNDVNQINFTHTINIYTPDNTTSFDPDDVQNA